MALPTVASDAYNILGVAPTNAVVGGAQKGTLTGNIALDGSYANRLYLDPGGAARDVTLDVEENIPSQGLVRVISNLADAAENLVVKNDAGSTIGTINQDEEGEFLNAGVQDGTASAWELVCVRARSLT